MATSSNRRCSNTPGVAVRHGGLQSCLAGSGFEFLAVTNAVRKRAMHQLFHQHAEHIHGLGKIGADENFETGVFRACRMPAFAETFALYVRLRERR